LANSRSVIKTFRTLVGEHVPADPEARASGFALEKEMNRKKLVLMIDGGFLRAVARIAQTPYDPNFIETFAKACPVSDEDLFRVLYYDCQPYRVGAAR
jgi:hypothetical protein